MTVVIEWDLTRDICVMQVSCVFFFHYPWVTIAPLMVNRFNIQKILQGNIFLYLYPIYLNRILMLLECKFRRMSLKDVTTGECFSISHWGLYMSFWRNSTQYWILNILNQWFVWRRIRKNVKLENLCSNWKGI